MRDLLRNTSVLALLLSGTPALAETPAPAEVVLPASKCPALFGDEAVREQNATARKGSLLSVVREEGVVEIVHGVAAWTAPPTRAVPGLTVLAVEPSEERLTARVRVDERWSAWCAPGVYRVDTDDALGAGNQVLAVLDEGLLASHTGSLVLVPSPGGLEKPPAFRMIWRSGFALAVASGGGGGGVSGAVASRANLGSVKRSLSSKSPRSLARPQRSLRK